MKSKSGVSLIAVLMFMLAATTASVVVFKWLGSENFSSAARLKRSEAYQASESGLDAVRAWLANKGADVGEVLVQYNETPTKPIVLTGGSNTTTQPNILGTVGGGKNQNYKVYLTKADLPRNGRKKLEFLSVGRGRDSSKVIQKAIFTIDGLYQITLQAPPEAPVGDCKYNDAYYGGSLENTQGTFSSGVVKGNLYVQGISTKGNLIVSGNMRVLDNKEKSIGCKDDDGVTRIGDLYVGGNWDARGFTVCGNAYVGGTLLGEYSSNLKFLRNLYANGGIEAKGFSVDSNLTLRGNLVFGNNNPNTVKGNFVMERKANTVPKIILSGDPELTIGGTFWSQDTVFEGFGTSNGYKKLNHNGGNGKLIIPGVIKCPTAGGESGFFCNDNREKGYYQKVGTEAAYFSSTAPSKTNPTTNNKPTGANELTTLAQKMSAWTQRDPLEIPQTTKDDWATRGKLLSKLVNTDKNITGVPDECIRLVLSENRCLNDWKAGTYDNWCNDNSQKGFGTDENGTLTSSWLYDWNWSETNQIDFASMANACYTKLKSNDPKGILFSTEKFLVLNVRVPQTKDVRRAFDGNFIFVFNEDMNSQMKLPATTDRSKVFIYFKKGATGTMPMENRCDPPAQSKNCKYNYFIFSEGDIQGSTGSGKINGAIFLADNKKVTGSLPDAGIDFNEELYESLLRSGALNITAACSGGTSGSSSNSNNNNNLEYDKRYIPVASRLLVELETKEISTTQEPTSVNYVKPTILVMPRLVRLDSLNEKFDKNYYTYMFANKRQNIDKVNPKTCTKIPGGGALSIGGGTNVKGLYKCEIEISSDEKPEFYVQVGEVKDVYIGISPGDKTILKKEWNEGKKCQDISLFTNKALGSAQKVTITMESGTGTGWTKTRLPESGTRICSGASPKWTCEIPRGQVYNSPVLRVCPETNDPTNNNIVLSLKENDLISKTFYESKIKFSTGITAMVERRDGSERACPNQFWQDINKNPINWLNPVTCGSKVELSPNDKWECDASPGAEIFTWNIPPSIVASDHQCKVPSQTSGSLTVEEGRTNTFNASLEWKSYNLVITGQQNTMKFISTLAGQVFECKPGDTCPKIYNNANYVVTLTTETTQRGYCINKSNCNSDGSNADGIVSKNNSFILNPTDAMAPNGTVTITLVKAKDPTLTCVLKRKPIKLNQNLNPSDFDITFSGAGCTDVTNPALTFTRTRSSSSSTSTSNFTLDSSGNFTQTGTYTIKVSSTACPAPVADCGTLQVDNNTNCDYTPDLCGGLVFNSVLGNSTSPPNSKQCLFISSYETIKATRTNGSDVKINNTNWNSSTRPATKDGGYYVYVANGRAIDAVNGGWNGIYPGAKNSACAEAECNVTANVYITKFTDFQYIFPDPPTYSCKDGTAKNARFNITYGGDVLGTFTEYDPEPDVGSQKLYCGTPEDNPPNDPCGDSTRTPNPGTHKDAANWRIKWNLPSATFHGMTNQGTGRVVRMYQVDCGNSTLKFGTKYETNGIICGTFDLVRRGRETTSESETRPTTPIDYSRIKCKVKKSCETRVNNGFVLVDKPDIEGCPDDGTATDPKFNIFDAADPTNIIAPISSNALSWNSNNGHRFYADRPNGVATRMYQITCAGRVINFANPERTVPGALGNDVYISGVDCGTFTIKSDCNATTPSSASAPSSSAAAPTATCKLSNRAGTAGVNSLAVTQGENIKPPRVTCSDGSSASSAQFIGLGTEVTSSWDTGGNAWYGAGADTTTTRTITMTSVICGGRTATINSPTCGTITVSRPTCRLTNGTDFTVPPNASIQPPSGSCGNASASSARFNITDNADVNIAAPTSNNPLNWNNNPPAAHGFGSTGSNRVVRMYEITCDGNSLAYGTSSQKNGIECGRINITQAPSSSSGGSSVCNSSTSVGDLLSATNLTSSNVNKCYRITVPCNPLKFGNYNDNNGSHWSGTIYCGNTSKTITNCNSKPCDEIACTATEAYLYITNVSSTAQFGTCWF